MAHDRAQIRVVIRLRSAEWSSVRKSSQLPPAATSSTLDPLTPGRCPFVPAHCERGEDADDEHHPDERVEDRVLEGPRSWLERPRRDVAEELPRRLGHRR